MRAACRPALSAALALVFPWSPAALDSEGGRARGQHHPRRRDAGLLLPLPDPRATGRKAAAGEGLLDAAEAGNVNCGPGSGGWAGGQWPPRPNTFTPALSARHVQQQRPIVKSRSPCRARLQLELEPHSGFRVPRRAGRLVHDSATSESLAGTVT